MPRKERSSSGLKLPAELDDDDAPGSRLPQSLPLPLPLPLKLFRNCRRLCPNTIPGVRSRTASRFGNGLGGWTSTLPPPLGLPLGEFPPNNSLRFAFPKIAMGARGSTLPNSIATAPGVASLPPGIRRRLQSSFGIVKAAAAGRLDDARSGSSAKAAESAADGVAADPGQAMSIRHCQNKVMGTRLDVRVRVVRRPSRRAGVLPKTTPDDRRRCSTRSCADEPAATR